MIRFKTILTDKDPLFLFLWEVYLNAFPEKERRSLDYHIETMSKEQFHCDVVLDNDEPIGILFWWDLGEFTFVEHLATIPTVRGKGYGSQILNKLISSGEKPILLEVEHPCNEICRRRIKFYERIGFVLNHYPYYQLSFKQIKGEPLSLLVMTHPKAITESELKSFISKEFPIIHFRNFR